MAPARPGPLPGPIQLPAIPNPATWPGSGVIKGAIGAGKNIVGAVTDQTTFLSRLTSPNLWLRIGEVTIGLLLLVVGINAMIKQAGGPDVVGGAAKTGKTAAKLAAIA